MQKNKKTNNNLLFSVILPIYNNEKWLKKCIDSIINQTYENFELILVDDGSTDSCPQICNDYAEKFNNIKVVHKENGGHTSARNTGMFQAKGEYIVFVDSDDWVTKNLLEKVYSAIEKYPNVDMVTYNRFCYPKNCNIYSDIYNCFGYHDIKSLKKNIIPYVFWSDGSKCVFLGTAWNHAIRKEHLLKHYCTDESIINCEDTAFTSECLYYANSVYFLEDKLYYHNLENENSIGNQRGYYPRIDFFEYIYKRFRNSDKDFKNQINYYYLNNIYNYYVIKIATNNDYKTFITQLKVSKICDLINSVEPNKLMEKKIKILLWLLKNKWYYIIWFITKCNLWDIINVYILKTFFLYIINSRIFKKN